MRYFILTTSLLVNTLLLASNAADQQVTLNVGSFDSISVPSGALSLTVSTATAGSEPESATTSSSITYLSTTANAKKIVGTVASLPASTTLALQVNPVEGSHGTSAGSVSLSSSAQDLLTAIPQFTLGDSTTSFSFTAPVAAGSFSGANATVTLTIQAN
ncbi:MAG: hypothetical protein P0S95_08300 [Rhabdochlamydiaceae bacterium]|nr:hypothetical protein [Candidatus Amphrikana amoebophyrae]